MSFIEREYKVDIRHIGTSNLITNYGILCLLEDIATVHSDIAGYGIAQIPFTHVSWILLNWKVSVLKRVAFGDTVKVRTWSVPYNELFTFRNFEIYDNDNNKVSYYDLSGRKLATVRGGTTFYKGHAMLILKQAHTIVAVVDTKFRPLAYYRTFDSNGGHCILDENIMRTKPFEPSGLYSINTFSSVIDSKGSLMFKAMENAFSNNRFGSFSQFSKDGYCIASNIEINGKQMLALVKGNGEIA